MANNNSLSMANIMAAIQEGCLTVEEIRRRLIAAIDLEYTKGDQANIQLIEGCENLLWELEFPKTPRPASCKAQLHRFLELEFERRERKAKHRRMLLRTVAVSTACLLVFLGAGNMLHWTWFENASTPDGQQYMVQGHEITVQMVESAIAEHQEAIYYDIENIEQLQAHLGFDPRVPNAVSETLTLSRCQMIFFPGTIQISAYYGSTDSDEYPLSYIVEFYTDMENAYSSIEQNEEGTFIKVHGCDVYISNNLSHASACWHTATAFYQLIGSLTTDEIISLIPLFEGEITE